MNHAGNSKTAEFDDGEEPKSADERDIYLGGECTYDPYFLYGFGKFGEESFGEQFEHEEVWKGIRENKEYVEKQEKNEFESEIYEH